MSKYSFRAKVEYLGPIISCKGVATDPMKIEAMLKWPSLVTVKQLKGFLSLIRYYRRFIKRYGFISKPLTELLKKDSFKWHSSTEHAFQQLK